MTQYRPLIRFIITAIGLYALWYFGYELFIAPAGTVDALVIDNTTLAARQMLSWIGYNALIEGQLVYVPDMGGAWIGNACNGIPLFALFAGFVIAYPGRWLQKLWFIPLGMLLVHLANIVRVVGLILIQVHAPDMMEFNHTYTFTILMYGLIFGLWVWWVRRVTVSP